MPTGVTSASLIVVIVLSRSGGGHRRRDTGKLCTGGRGCFGVRIHRDSGGRGRKNTLVNRLSGAGPDQGRIPAVVAVFGVIGSIAGSLAGKELLDQAGGAYTSVWLGTVAGLASAVLVALLLITYHMYPEPSRG